jgi:hypothetical protein
MSSKIIQTTIRFGDLELSSLQLPNTDYWSPGLFKLAGTDIYLYGDEWYWLSCRVPSALEKHTFWDSDRGGCLSVQGNRLHHIFNDPLRGTYQHTVKISYLPIPHNLHSVLHYCSLGDRIPVAALEQLYRELDRFVFDLGELGRVVL